MPRPKGWRGRALVLGPVLVEDLGVCTRRHAEAMARHYRMIGVRVRIVNTRRHGQWR
jgi:hypothetical protein